MLTLTQSLLTALLGAALIGACIGWLARRIIAIKERNALFVQNRNRLQLLNDEIKLLRDEDNRMEEELSKTKAMISAYEKAAGESVKQASEFSAALKRKDQRVSELESQVLASEEQHMRVQRDFAKLRMTKTREVQQLRQQLSDRVASAGGVEIQLGAENGEDLPVLQKKNDAEEAAPAPGAATTPAASTAKTEELSDLYDLSAEILDTDEDIFDMTSEFDFEAAESMLDAKEKFKLEVD